MFTQNLKALVFRSRNAAVFFFIFGFPPCSIHAQDVRSSDTRQLHIGDVKNTKADLAAISQTKKNTGEQKNVRESSDDKLSKFAADVILHVVIHELAHALIREFDLPILGNEETMADAFATHYLTTYHPDRALDVLKARAVSLMIEAEEVPRKEWSFSGEHNNDARRAYQIVALAIAADPKKYASLAKIVQMSESNIRTSKDYGTEIHRSWRRVLRPLWMPKGVASKEVRFVYDSGNKLVNEIKSGGVTDEIESIVKQFDWHSQITIYIAEGEGRAGWSRSKRTITIHSDYIQRFDEQGKTEKSKRPR
jgi:hypothetical protein